MINITPSLLTLVKGYLAADGSRGRESPVIIINGLRSIGDSALTVEYQKLTRSGILEPYSGHFMVAVLAVHREGRGIETKLRLSEIAISSVERKAK